MNGNGMFPFLRKIGGKLISLQIFILNLIESVKVLHYQLYTAISAE
jgi:hypothetical protein